MAHSELYQQGRLSIQDESSMLVAELVDPQPGMRVLDCCAAPGGKTSHIAERMNDTGTIYANDIHLHKQKLIQDQAERLGLSSIETMVSDALELDQRFEAAYFDRILLDAPCSGLGVIRRKPDLKWLKQEEEIAELPALQLQLLSTAAKLLKPDGRLIYSTCTIEPEENEELIAKFLLQHPQFELDTTVQTALPESLKQRMNNPPGMVRILPHDFHSDGFFIARLRVKV